MSFEYEVVKAAGTDAPALNTASPTKIKVVGCGGCGGNAVNTMIESGVGGVEFIAMNTDLQALSQNKAQYKIQIGQKLAGGLGAGGKPEVGEESAKEQQEQIKELLKDSDMVFITAGMGGGTGTGSAPVVAKIARDLGALTVAVVTTPFKFEGKVRMAHAEEGVRKLRDEVDSLIAIPNELILKDSEKRLSVPMAFTLINDILRQGVQGISDIITKPGLVNRDFRDVESVMKGQGDAILGIGIGEGDNRAVDAAHNAINNRLLVDTNIDGAKNVLINICGNNDVGIAECNEIAQIITERANPDAVVLWGQVLDEAMEDKISVTVIATGFNKIPAEEKAPETPHIETQSDTMSFDEFERIKVPKPKIETAAPAPEPKKNDFMAGIFGNEQIYEDNGKNPAAHSSSQQTFMHKEPAPEKKDILSDFTRVSPSQPHASSSTPLTPPAGFSGLSDMEQPAVWRRNLEGLSRGISIGKK
ncbi:MAG: cell division protein FtsZ [Treponema sp.]|uniref:cell division protein FtsZ n=1 Tax=Treponema sp. TaxID=166 RepID=UPI0025F5E360|nr:cell division protein FtsZ [Treponema sp.]MBR0495118.1 cell division protein FtsZ [Treponema sp.]